MRTNVDMTRAAEGQSDHEINILRDRRIPLRYGRSDGAEFMPITDRKVDSRGWKPSGIGLIGRGQHYSANSRQKQGYFSCGGFVGFHNDILR